MNILGASSHDDAPRDWDELFERMGEDPRGVAIVTGFVNQGGCASGPDDHPDHQILATAFGDGHKAVGVSFPLLPDYREYLLQQGFANGQLLQVEPADVQLAGLPESQRELYPEFRPAIEARWRIAGALSVTDEQREADHASLLGYPNGSVEAAMAIAIRNDPAFAAALKGRKLFPTFANEDTQTVYSLLTPQSPPSAEAAVRANHKAEARRAAKEFGFLVPPGIERDGGPDRGEILSLFLSDIRSLQERFPGCIIWIKAAHSLAGNGVVKLETPQDAEEALSTLLENLPPNGDGVPDLVAEVNVGSLPGRETSLNMNVQATVGDTVEMFGYSRQLVDGATYLGNLIGQNENPSVVAAIRDAVVRVGEWTKSIGYRGVIGIDVIVAQVGGRPEAYVVDVNARYNSSTPHLLLRKHIEAGYWLNTTAEMPRPVEGFGDFSEQVGQSLLHLRGRAKGVVPMCFDTVAGVLPSQKVQLGVYGRDYAGFREVQEGLRSRNIKLGKK